MKSDWVKAKLGDVCMIERGGSPRPITDYLTNSTDGINWIKIGDAVEGSKYITSTSEKIKPEGMKKSRFVKKGDFILSNSMSFGKPYILGIDGCIHDGWLVIRDKENVFDKSFLYYYLGSERMYRQFEKLAAGGVVKNLNSHLVRNVDVVIPPIEEQQRIVDELDLLSDIIRKKNAQLSDLNALTTAYFYELFGDPVENPRGWIRKRIGDIAHVKIGPFGSLLHKSDYISGGTPLVNPVQMKDLRIVMDNDFTISDSKKQELNNYLLKEGDIVIARRGDIGRCALVTAKDDGYLCGTGSMFVRPAVKIDSLFLVHLLSTKEMVRELLHQAKGVTMLNINCDIISNLGIIVPPIEEQNNYLTKIIALENQKRLILSSIHATELLLNSRTEHYFAE